MSMIEWAVEILSWLFIASGSIFLLIGAIGAVKFPDFWSRLHAVSVSDSGGMILLTAGMIMQAGLTLITVKLVLIGVFLFITGPTASHAVANAAFVSGYLPNGNVPPELTEVNDGEAEPSEKRIEG
ncbi:MAG: monovalent cation/H(+) antiporter subunit G [Pseudomonadota bacterium]